MRSLVIVVTIGLLPATIAWGQTAGPGQPGAAARPPASQQRTASPQATNEEARRREEERHKRWNDRMRRATKSLCDGC